MKYCPTCLRQWRVDGKQKCPYCDIALVDQKPVAAPAPELTEALRSVEFIVTVCQHERSKLKPAGLDGHLNAIEGAANETLLKLKRLSAN